MPGWPGNPHRPVVFRLAANFDELYVLRFSTCPSLPTDLPFGPSPRPCCWAAAAGATDTAVALCRLGAPPHVIKGSLNVATDHACVTAAAEHAAKGGREPSAAQTRSFGLAPQLRWTRAVSSDQRPPDGPARAAGAAAVAARLLRELLCVSSSLPSPPSQHALLAAKGACNAALCAVGDFDTPAAPWQRRCTAAVAQALQSPAPVEPEQRSCFFEGHEQALAAATDALTALRHASGDSWRDWAATASRGGGGAAHSYIRGRKACQPAVVRRRDNLALSGRTDYIIAHHTQTWTEHWCRDDLPHRTDDHISDALERCPRSAPPPPPALTPSQLRDASAAFTTRTSCAP